jgi:hypothetical protein
MAGYAASQYRPEKLTGSDLESLLVYNPNDGLFRHKTSRGPRSDGAGSVAGAIMSHGYVCITLFQRQYTAHRLAWLWMIGSWPEEELDHINGDRSDNRIVNLRLATRSKNAQNGSLRSNNSTGHIGVSFDSRRGKYVARVMIDGMTVFQKRFDTLAEAVSARLEKESEVFGEFSPARNRRCH